MVASQVFESPQFAQLSEQQRTFLQEMCRNGWDKLAAANTAWKCKDNKSAEAQANRALRHPVISALIALIDPSKSRMTKDEALQIAAKHARSCEDASDAIKCLQLIGKWEGWENDPAPPIPGTPKDIYAEAEML